MGPSRRRSGARALVELFGALLELLSENLYQIWWYGGSWWELQRARNDPSMRPVWHALAMYVPIYGLFRLHAHYRVLNETASGAGATDRVSPWLMVVLAVVRAFIGSIAAWIVLSVTIPAMLDIINAAAAARPGVIPATPRIALPPSVFLLTLVGFAIGAWQLTEGRRSSTPTTRPGRRRPRRARSRSSGSSWCSSRFGSQRRRAIRTRRDIEEHRRSRFERHAR